MTISKKLQISSVAIVAVVIVQAIFGTVLAHRIHALSQSQNAANRNLIHLQFIQETAHKLSLIADEGPEHGAAFRATARPLISRVLLDIAALQAQAIAQGAEQPLSSWEDEMYSNAQAILLKTRKQSASAISAGELKEIKLGTHRIIDISNKLSVENSALIEQQSKAAKRLLLYFQLLLCAACTLIVFTAAVQYVYVRKHISANIQLLIKTTESVTAGNIGERIKIDNEDEFARLASSFNAMLTILELAQEQAIQLSKDSRQRYVQMITAFVKAIEAKDVYTRGHSENVAYYVTKICEAFEWAEEDIENMRIAALLHDMGKIGVKEDILNKKGKLTEEEFRHIMEHPRISRDILGNFGSLEAIANVAVHHHERYDGRGYPDGLEGEDIPFGARMLAVVDAFDAMVTARPYKPAMPVEEALAELEKGSGTHFDPMIVMVFVDLVREGKVVVDTGSEQRSAAT